MNRTISTSFTILCLLSTMFFICSNIQLIKADGTSIQVSPNTTVDKGDSFILNITVDNVARVHSWEVDLKFRRIINITSVVGAGWQVYTYGYDYYELITYSFVEFSGSGVLAELNFTAVYGGTTQIEILNSEIFDPSFSKIPHTYSSCNVTVLGKEQYFLNIIPPSGGALNVTSGTHVYDKGTDVAIEATEVTEEFQYIKVDNTTYTTKTVTITMNSDHEVSALFKFPVLTIYTNEPDVYIYIHTARATVLQTVAAALHLNYR